jgi:hypothetical protein
MATRTGIAITTHVYYLCYQLVGEDLARLQFPDNIVPAIPRIGELVFVKDNKSEKLLELRVKDVSYRSSSNPNDQRAVHKVKVALE